MVTIASLINFIALINPSTNLQSQNFGDYSNLLHNPSSLGESDNLTNALVWLLPDVILYSGLVGLLLAFGLSYKTGGLLSLILQQARLVKLILNLVIFILVVQCTLLIFSTSSLNVFTTTLLHVGHLNEVGKLGLYALDNSLYIDVYSQILKLVVALSALINLILILNTVHFTLDPTGVSELPILLYIAVSLGFTIISSTQFAVLLLALEGFSLVLYVLTTLDRTHGGIAASVKYFVFGTLGSVFLFWGVVHIYMLVASLNYSTLAFSMDYSSAHPLGAPDQSSLNFAGSAVLLGLLIKLGAAPLHQWVADVYTGSYTPVTLFFATVVKFIIFMIFCRMAYYFQLGSLVSVFAVSSLFVGTFLTLQQMEIKRFLAYGSVTHVGFLLIGDLPSTFIYIVSYLLATGIFFSVLLTVRSYNKELVYLTDLANIKKSGLGPVLLLVVSLASMAGLPPFAGFFGKFMVWGSLVEDIYLYSSVSDYLLLLATLVLTILTIFYYMRLVIYIFVGSDISAEPGVSVILSTAVRPSTLVAAFSAAQLTSVTAIAGIFWIFIQPLLLELSVAVAGAVSS